MKTFEAYIRDEHQRGVTAHVVIVEGDAVRVVTLDEVGTRIQFRIEWNSLIQESATLRRTEVQS